MNDVTIHFLQKMIFIYNAVLNGWVVRRIDNEFQFTKNSESTTGNLNDFLKSNIQIPEELKQIMDNIPQSLNSLDF